MGSMGFIPRLRSSKIRRTLLPPLMRRFLLPAACFLSFAALCHAGDSLPANALRVTATPDSTEVHPDSVFEVTLSIENLTGVAQKLKMPERLWDHLWKSSNRLVTWDAWDDDEDKDITIEIAPHQTYVFPDTIKMFVDDDITKRTRVDFKMGFRPATFTRTFWSAPITLDVTP